MKGISRVGAAAVIVVIGALLIAANVGGAAATATFSIVAGQTAGNAVLNFNGKDKGHLIITVPVGAEVTLTLTNKGDLPHSIQIIPYTDKIPAQAQARAAFPGAETPDPQQGILKGKTAVAKFTASKPGKYLLICGFPGHALLGMYGLFEVSASADTQPTLVAK
jgi:sulfocyanin